MQLYAIYIENDFPHVGTFYTIFLRYPPFIQILNRHLLWALGSLVVIVYTCWGLDQLNPLTASVFGGSMLCCCLVAQNQFYCHITGLQGKKVGEICFCTSLPSQRYIQQKEEWGERRRRGQGASGKEIEQQKAKTSYLHIYKVPEIKYLSCFLLHLNFSLDTQW